MDSIIAFKENLGGSFELLFTEMTMRSGVHPNSSKLDISGKFVESEYPKKNVDLIGDIGLPDGFEDGCFLQACCPEG